MKWKILKLENNREKEGVSEAERLSIGQEIAGLQAEKLQLLAVYHELQKQKTISMSSNSTTGKLGSPSI